MLRKLIPSALQPIFNQVWKPKDRPLEYHETWPLVFFEPDIAQNILPQAVRSFLAQKMMPTSLKPKQGDLVAQARKLQEQFKAGSPNHYDFRSVALMRHLIMMADAHERGDSSLQSQYTASSDFMAQVSDEIAIRLGTQRHSLSLGLYDRPTDKWLVDENLHGMEEVPGTYMGRGHSFLMQAAWSNLRSHQENSRLLLQRQIQEARSLPPEEMVDETRRLLAEHHQGMQERFRAAVSLGTHPSLDDMVDTSLFEKMAGLNDRDVLTLSIGRSCAVVVSKDRNPGHGDDGLCRLHLNRAIEVMDMLERMDMGPHSSLYPYALHTMPMIVLPIVPEVKGNLRLAEEIVLRYADEIGKLAASKAVPLIKVSDEGGVESFGNYRQLRNWQGARSAAEFQDSEELISRLGHFANGDKFFRRSKFQHLAPVGQALGLVRC